MLITLRDTTLAIADIFAWRVDPRHYPGTLSQLELSQGDNWITTVWMRPFHLSFPVLGNHHDALHAAFVRYHEAKGEACSSTSMQTVRRPSAD